MILSMVTLATASLPYKAEASNYNIATVINQEQEEEKEITGKVVHIYHKSVSCYEGTELSMTALSDFKYEIIRVATDNGNILKLIIPQSTTYIVGDKFNENVEFYKDKRANLNDLVIDNSEFNGIIQETNFNVDGQIKR